jgi:GAF domain-containing protein
MTREHPDPLDAEAAATAAALRDAYAVIADLRARLDEYGWMDGALRRRTGELAERVKELECLHAVAAALRDPRRLPADAFAEAARTIPAGFQHPARTCACLEIHGHEYRSPGYRAEGRTCAVDIRGGGRRIGALRVHLRPAAGAAPAPAAILPEEQAMLETLAELIGEFAANRTAGRA